MVEPIGKVENEGQRLFCWLVLGMHAAIIAWFVAEALA